jgi:hypothetical protein
VTKLGSTFESILQVLHLGKKFSRCSKPPHPLPPPLLRRSHSALPNVAYGQTSLHAHCLPYCTPITGIRTDSLHTEGLKSQPWCQGVKRIGQVAVPPPPMTAFKDHPSGADVIEM